MSGASAHSRRRGAVPRRDARREAAAAGAKADAARRLPAAADAAPPPRKASEGPAPAPPARRAVARDPPPKAPNPGIDRRTAERLRKGEMAIERRIDLHGMTQDHAHATLDRFIAAAWGDGMRMLLVITGKGNVGSGGGVLRRSRAALARRRRPRRARAADRDGAAAPRRRRRALCAAAAAEERTVTPFGEKLRELRRARGRHAQADGRRAASCRRPIFPRSSTAIAAARRPR